MQEHGKSEVYEMLLLVVRSLVDHPESIGIEVITDGECTRFSVRATSDDVIRLMGKNGRTAHAIRIILSAIASRLRCRLVLDIVDNQAV